MRIYECVIVILKEKAKEIDRNQPFSNKIYFS